MSEQAVGIGHNEPPSEQQVFRDRLDASNEELLTLYMRLDRDKRRLPIEVKTEADAAAITAWVIRAKGVAKLSEERRVSTKEPYLTRGKWIDGYFGEITNIIHDAAKAIDARKLAFLRAEEARKKAEAEARIDEERRKAREAQERADRLAEEAAKAEAEKAAAEEELRQAAKRAAADQEAAAETLAAETRLREAHATQEALVRQTEAAQTEARKSDLAVERAEARAASPARASKVTGGGGNSKVEMSWVARIQKPNDLLDSMGPAGRFFSDTEIAAMLDRAAKANPRPTIPGVEFSEVASVKTTALRKS